jgi:hypothetical protein
VVIAEMTKQEVAYAAIAIPVISFMAIAVTKRTAQVVGKIWGWFLKTIAGQTANAIRDIVQPSLEGLHSDLMESIEILRTANSREHVETQIRLRDVETRLSSVETRLAAVELAVASAPAVVASAAVEVNRTEDGDAVVDGASTSVDLQGADGGRRAGDRVRTDS